MDCSPPGSSVHRVSQARKLEWVPGSSVQRVSQARKLEWVPGSSVHRVSQARKLEWVAISFSKGSSPHRDRTHISCIAGGFSTTEPPGKPTRNKVKCESQRCSVVSNSCDPMDYTVRGILQARIQELVAFPFSRGSSQPRDRTQIPRIAGGFFTS